MTKGKKSKRLKSRKSCKKVSRRKKKTFEEGTFQKYFRFDFIHYIDVGVNIIVDGAMSPTWCFVQLPIDNLQANNSKTQKD